MKTNHNHMQTKNLNKDMTCPICHSSEISDYLELYRCKICTHMFSKNIHDDDYWQDLYENKYNVIHRKHDEKRKQMYRQEVKWISKSKKLEGTFLDVGCAHGDFFSFLPKEMKKIGMDLSTQVIEDAKKLHPDCEFHKTNIFEFIDKNKFNFIQFRGVLQHSVDPVNNLKYAINLLEKDGVIIITSLPDFSSLASKFYKRNFGFYAPKLSPHFFTKKSFLFMLQSLGLKVLAYDSPYLKTPYANLPKDLLLFFINKFRNKTNPPFFGNVKNYIVGLDHSAD